MTVTGLALLVWSVYTYLTVRIDADMVAEAIQVRKWLEEPFWVMSYPGQMYGGVLEYPLMAAAELLAPGNVYGFTLLRILYVPIVGLLMCVNVRRLNPSWSLWPLALAAVVAPALLHGIMSVKDLYPFSWLVAAGGVTVLYAQFAGGGRAAPLVLGGVLVGLGIYEHPTAGLFALPMVVAGMVHFTVTGRRAVNTLIGLVLGLLPIILQPEKETSYGTGMPTHPRLAEAFGLTGTQDSWTGAFVPNAWGFQLTDANDLALPPGAQFIVNALLATAIAAAVIAALPALRGYLKGRTPPAYAFLSVLWATAAVCVVVLSSVVRPIFYYGGSLSFLAWITLAALPSVLGRTPRLVLTSGVLLLMGVTSVGALLASTPRFPASIGAKREQAAEVRAVADAISDAGIRYVFGSYWEALPVAFASAGRLHPLTVVNNRFPLPPGQVGPIAVAVLGSLDAWERARAVCRELPEATDMLPTGVGAFECPAEALIPRAGVTVPIVS